LNGSLLHGYDILTDGNLQSQSGNGIPERMRIDATTGNLGIGTTYPGSYKLYMAGPAYFTHGWRGSDERRKKHIKLLDNFLELSLSAIDNVSIISA